MKKYTDEELLKMFHSGDSTGFELLFKKYKKPIFNFLLRLSNNNEIATDLTQDVFLKIINKSNTFSQQSKFSTWIYTIARNTATDQSRKAKHRNHLSLDHKSPSTNQSPLDIISSKQASPEENSTQKELGNQINQAIDSLPDEQKEVFLLKEYHGLTFDEISAIVQAKPGTVKSRMRYALESLREKLEQLKEYTEETQ